MAAAWEIVSYWAVSSSFFLSSSSFSSSAAATAAAARRWRSAVLMAVSSRVLATLMVWDCWVESS